MVVVMGVMVDMGVVMGMVVVVVASKFLIDTLRTRDVVDMVVVMVVVVYMVVVMMVVVHMVVVMVVVVDIMCEPRRSYEAIREYPNVPFSPPIQVEWCRWPPLHLSPHHPSQGVRKYRAIHTLPPSGVESCRQPLRLSLHHPL